jgi:hypothetical protein
MKLVKIKIYKFLIKYFLLHLKLHVRMAYKGKILNLVVLNLILK